jgi:hypothetical protein
MECLALLLLVATVAALDFEQQHEAVKILSIPQTKCSLHYA